MKARRRKIRHSCGIQNNPGNFRGIKEGMHNGHEKLAANLSGTYG